MIRIRRRSSASPGSKSLRRGSAFVLQRLSAATYGGFTAVRALFVVRNSVT
jgi:hypothetical protein